MVLLEIWSLGYKPFHDLANPILNTNPSTSPLIEWTPVGTTGDSSSDQQTLPGPAPWLSQTTHHLMVECWYDSHTHLSTQ